MGAPSDLVFNPFAFTVHEDPYAIYRRLRDEAPAYWNPELRFWAISRFADVQAAFKAHDVYSSANGISLESRGGANPIPIGPLADRCGQPRRA